MELVVILLFVLSIAVVSALVGRIQKRRAAEAPDGDGDSTGKTRPAAQRPARPRSTAETGTSPQAAKEAASLLNAAQHQQVYAALAQGQPVKALKLYAQFTGAGIRASGAAIQNMAAHPQPYVRPIPETDGKPAPSAENPTPAAKPDELQEEEISKWAQQLRPEDFLKP
ncbi:hypothetical protein LJ754_14335 [Arthrobacter sp. zg-Y40]|uniref:hypothetical protein n=1 Tax=Arthrobacter sp. zg-Y40 TaxID=2886939 RepID=UPI001D150890|nr:hypothetical protein [Arthrobacter sp. zg-Y40]MCC3280327.1 hypothetical protein [Arthrobacter sp. zg-Y40]